MCSITKGSDINLVTSIGPKTNITRTISEIAEACLYHSSLGITYFITIKYLKFILTGILLIID